MRIIVKFRGSVALVGIAAAVLAGCADDRDHSAGRESCGLLVEYRGKAYGALEVPQAPPAGRALGLASVAPCDEGEQGDIIKVSRLRGVPPRDALVWVGRPDLVLVREGAGEPLPAIDHLLVAPTCKEGRVPLRLSGDWLGIAEPDGAAERDLIPPYDLHLFVRHASAGTYERSTISVRVPAALGSSPVEGPVSRADVASALWKSGTIEASVTCRDGLFVAGRVEAIPSQ